MGYPTVGWEKAMDVQEIMLNALSGEFSGFGPRTFWRGRERLRTRGPAAMLTLPACAIAILDDATNQVLHAARHPSELRLAVMTTLAALFRTHGLSVAL